MSGKMVRGSLSEERTCKQSPAWNVSGHLGEERSGRGGERRPSSWEGRGLEGLRKEAELVA